MKNSHSILVVDDDQAVRRILEYKLDKRGYNIQTATNGAEALELLQKKRVDVLLTDVRMPKLSGTELLMEAQRLDNRLAVILITAHATVQQAVEANRLQFANSQYSYAHSPRQRMAFCVPLIHHIPHLLLLCLPSLI